MRLEGFPQDIVGLQEQTAKGKNTRGTPATLGKLGASSFFTTRIHQGKFADCTQGIGGSVEGLHSARHQSTPSVLKTSSRVHSCAPRCTSVAHRTSWEEPSDLPGLWPFTSPAGPAAVKREGLCLLESWISEAWPVSGTMLCHVPWVRNNGCDDDINPQKHRHSFQAKDPTPGNLDKPGNLDNDARHLL